MKDDDTPDSMQDRLGGFVLLTFAALLFYGLYAYEELVIELARWLP